MNDGLEDAVWQKSTFSNGTGACVEVAFLPGGNVALRESDQPEDVVITSAVKWDAFIAGVRNSEFDRP